MDPPQPRQCIGNNTIIVDVIVVVTGCCAFIQITLSNQKYGEGVGRGIRRGLRHGAAAGNLLGTESNAMFGIVYTIQMILLFVDL